MTSKEKKEKQKIDDLLSRLEETINGRREKKKNEKGENLERIP